MSGETKAWACLGANALALPGLGSAWAGRWISGVLQAVFAVVGFAMSMYWTFGWLNRLISTGTLPQDPGPHFEAGVAGVLLFLLGWMWSVGTGIALVRAARRQTGAS